MTPDNQLKWDSVIDTFLDVIRSTMDANDKLERVLAERILLDNPKILEAYKILKSKGGN